MEVCPKDQPTESADGIINARNLERGLSSLANVDVENLFGPWMIVDKRYKRSKTILHSDKKKGIVASGSGGSQFAVLDPDVMEDDQGGFVANEVLEFPRVMEATIREGELSPHSNHVQS
ncbi:hypothetical protein V6N13_133430 [Hibiscus sabdariffa]